MYFQWQSMNNTKIYTIDVNRPLVVPLVKGQFTAPIKMDIRMEKLTCFQPGTLL